jgi:hypothetical protein
VQHPIRNARSARAAPVIDRSDDPSRPDPSRPDQPVVDRPIDPLRRRLIASTAAAPLLVAGCATPFDRGVPVASIPAATRPKVNVGDRWVYQTINLYNRSVIDEMTAEVVAMEPETRVRLAARDAGTVVEERYAGAWSVISEATFDRPITFEAPMPLVPDPPQIGSSRDRSRYRAQDYRDVLQWEQRLWADRWERLEVPAGPFDCLRILRMINFQHPDIFRYGSERTDTLWYAPAANRWVQREWTGSFMPDGPAPFGGRVRDDWVRWQLMSYQPAR